MGRYKYLLKNIGLLALSSFATKILSFLLVPLYTNILSTSDYGTYDLFITTIEVLLPILTLNIQESTLRFSLESKYDKKAVVSNSFFTLCGGFLALIVLLAINYLTNIYSIINQYVVYFILIYMSQSLLGIIIAYTRGIDKIKELSISSIIASLITLLSNILFLMVFKLGLKGYFIANILGPTFQCIYLIVKSKFINNVNIGCNYKKERKEMLSYSCPMIANSVAWWINSASDKYLVVFFQGLTENGIYSVASKIPSILNVFQSIFTQAWTLSAVKDFDSEDKTGFFSNTYKMYNCLLVVMCSIIILFDKILAYFLYAKDFYAAWRYVPWLTIAIVFGSLSGYIGGFFSAVKNSKIYAKSSIIGATINIILNIIFIPLIGTIGAAYSTTICYFVIWLIRYRSSRKIITMKVNIFRDLFSYFLLIIQSMFLLIIKNNCYLYIAQLFCVISQIICYNKDVRLLLGKINNRERRL